MTKQFLALLAVWGITISARIFTLFCAPPFKALFFRRESCFGAAVLFLGLGILPAAADAQPQCGLRDDVLQTLATRYQEFPIHAGLTHNGAMLEVVATESGSTWSIVLTGYDGITCLVAAGEGWRVSPQPEAGEPS